MAVRQNKKSPRDAACTARHDHPQRAGGRDRADDGRDAPAPPTSSPTGFYRRQERSSAPKASKPRWQRRGLRWRSIA